MRDRLVGWAVNSAGWLTALAGEATVKACGVAVARLPGYSWVPPWPIGVQ